MSSRTQVHHGMLAVGLLLMLAGGCQFVKPPDDVAFTCEPENHCASDEEICSRNNRCIPRAQAIQILAPKNGDKVNGVTRVEVDFDVAGDPPESIDLTITFNGQSSTLPLKLQDSGTYVAQWTPNKGDGPYTLLVKNPNNDKQSSDPVTVEATKDAPAFTIKVPAPEGPASVGPLILRDPQATTAWRRDQSVTITVTSDTRDLNAATVQLTVIGAGPTSEGRAETPVAVQRVQTCAQAYCGTVQLDLSVPELSRFRGPFKLQVTGKDQAGRSGSGTAEVQVTRWKWELNLGQEIRTSVAIGEGGIIYLGTRNDNRSAGEFVAIRPDGVVATHYQTETPLDALSIGHTAGGAEVLFVTVGQTPTQPLPQLIAIRSSDGQVLGQCIATESTDQGNSRLTLGSGPASDNSRKDVALIGFHRKSTSTKRLELLGMRLDEPSVACLSHSPLGEDSFSSLVSDGERFYFSVNNAQAVTAIGPDLVDQPPVSVCPLERVRLSLIGKELIAAHLSDGIGNKVDPNTRACTAFSPGGGSGTKDISNMAIDSQRRLFYGKKGTNNKDYLARTSLEPGNGPPLERELADQLILTPTLGQGGWVYTTTDNGTLQAWTRDLQPVWQAKFEGAYHGLSNLDCTRNEAGQPQSRPGVWYMAQGTRLRAFIIDSHGIDTTAAWPRGQRDPHNSGNSSVDLNQFACP